MCCEWAELDNWNHWPPSSTLAILPQWVANVADFACALLLFAAYRRMCLFMAVYQHNATVHFVIVLVGAEIYCLYIIFQPRKQSSSIFIDEYLLSTVFMEERHSVLPCLLKAYCVRRTWTDAEFIRQVLAHLLDMVFYSDEKERVIPLLVNIMHYVVPYLRNHRWEVTTYHFIFSQTLLSLRFPLTCKTKHLEFTS